MVQAFARLLRPYPWDTVSHRVDVFLEVIVLAQSSRSDKDNFLYPTGHYRGEFTLENVTFNANLQEFAQRVGFICNLETGGKISSEQAYNDIKQLWDQLRDSKKSLLDHPDYPTPDLPPE